MSSVTENLVKIGYKIKVFSILLSFFKTRLFFLILLLLALISLSFFIPPQSPPVLSSSPPLPLSNKTNLEDIVQNQLKGADGSFAVAIKNLKTNESYYFNSTQSYYSASLYKLWVMAAVYQKVEQGDLKEDPSLDTNLSNMITLSDNYSSDILVEDVGLGTLSSFVKSNGFNQSTIGGESDSPTTTASDVSLFFEKLYKGELANKTDTQKMINLLKSQELNEKIPKYLPKDISIAHKTGDLYSQSHDGGIIYTPQGDYILVVLSDTPDPAQANEYIANVSKAVYEYFISK